MECLIWIMQPLPSLMQPLPSLMQRSRDYALRILRLYGSLPSGVMAQTLGKQLLRSGTSVGAQLRESRRSRSDSEMISKTESALQELEESAYWIDLLGESGVVEKSRLSSLMHESDELIAILVSGIKRLKSRQPFKLKR